jgi:hypothetical protein
VMYPYQVEGRAEQVLEGGVGVEVALGASVVAVGDVVGVGVLGACALGDSFSCGGDAFSAGELLEGAVGFAPRLRLQPPRPCAGLRGFAPTGTPNHPRARLASRVQSARARLGTGLLVHRLTSKERLYPLTRVQSSGLRGSQILRRLNLS